MKITYEFDPYEDRDDLKMVQYSYNFYSALSEIYQLCRDVRKGHRELKTDSDIEKFIDEISDLIYQSKYHEIE